MSGCGKMVFSTRAEANKHARGSVKKNHRRVAGFNGGARKMQAYRCRFCGLWHLTSMSKAEQRRKGLL